MGHYCPLQFCLTSHRGQNLMAYLVRLRRSIAFLLTTGLILGLGACSSDLETAPATADQPVETPIYKIGPGDSLSIFVWRNPDLSTSVTVRPDGRISVPLLEDLEAANRTPTQLSREIETELGKYVQDPLVTVIVGGFVGTYAEQVRVVGEAVQPIAVPYRANMTLLDLMITAGGLTDFADGNSTVLVRTVDGEQQEYRVRVADLLKDGDISANVAMLPGDVLIVPQSIF